jgi:glutaredoxin-dependent peroxiredoxin
MLLLRDRRRDFEEAGVTPYGVSRDSPWSHVAWVQALDLDGVQLLSDWNGEAVRAFGIGHPYRGLEGVASRSAFLVDGEGMIRGAWRYEPSEVPDCDALLSAARSLS